MKTLSFKIIPFISLLILLSSIRIYADDPVSKVLNSDLANDLENLEKNFIVTGFVNTSAPLIDNYEFYNTSCINTGVLLNGCNVSLLHSPYTAYGFNASRGLALAGMFTLPDGLWKIDSAWTYGYQTGSTWGSTITSLTIRIQSGGMPGGPVLFGDFSENRLIRTIWSCIYRNNDYVTANRPVMRNTGRVGTTLPGGSGNRYWLEFTMTGNFGDDVFVPPVEGSGGGYQFYSWLNWWRELRDGVNGEYWRDIPFAVFGNPGCEWSSYPQILISNATYNGDTTYLECSAVLSLPNRGDVFEYDLGVTDENLVSGDSITLDRSIMPDTNCYRVEILPELPVTSAQPINVHVKITRKPNSPFVCEGLVEFSATDKCVTPNVTFCRTAIDRPLPVELTSFTSMVDGNTVHLNWTTSSEVNSSIFNIERRSLQYDWRVVGTVNAKGNSTSSTEYSFTDGSLISGIYKYRLKQIDFNGNFEYFELPEAVTIGVPDKFFLEQNYPNPFNPATTIVYGIPEAGNVMLKIFDMSGREIKTIVNEFKDAGHYTAKFDASGLASGAYFYRLAVSPSNPIESGSYVAVKKMVYLK
jgi:hypothetical protein